VLHSHSSSYKGSPTTAVQWPNVFSHNIKPIIVLLIYNYKSPQWAILWISMCNKERASQDDWTYHLAEREYIQRLCQLSKMLVHTTCEGSLTLTAVDSVCLLIRDFNAELLLCKSAPGRSISYILTYLLNGHHNLNGVQTVQTEIVCKVRCRW